MSEPPPEAPELNVTEDELRRHIRSLWLMVERFSKLAEHPCKDEDNLFRWRQVRFKAAVVARTAGQMDDVTFGEEQSSYVSEIAHAMGGIAFQLSEQDATKR